MKNYVLFLVCVFFTAKCYPQSARVDSTTQMTIKGEASDSLVDLAKSFIGIPYKYGGATPSVGFDCSGFVKYVYGNFGLDLPRTTSELAKIGIEIPLDSCKKGDLMVFSGRNSVTKPIGHIGIVTSDLYEPISFIHSATSRNRGVVISAFDKYDYYKSRFVKVVRVLDQLSN